MPWMNHLTRREDTKNLPDLKQNACWAASVIQCLSHLGLLDWRQSPSSPLEWKFLDEWVRGIIDSTTVETVHPDIPAIVFKAITKAIAKNHQELVYGQQQCAAEGLQSIANMRIDASMVDRMHFEERAHRRCMKCGFEEWSPEPYHCLMVAIMDKNGDRLRGVNTVANALHNYCKERENDGKANCNKCTKKAGRTMKTARATATAFGPDDGSEWVFTIHIKRALMNKTGNAFKGVIKLIKDREFDLGAKVSPGMAGSSARLVAMVIHHGESVTSGHYTAIIDHDEVSDGKSGWFMYDDRSPNRNPTPVGCCSTCNKLFPSEDEWANKDRCDGSTFLMGFDAVKEQEGYLLFYKVRRHDNPDSHATAGGTPGK